MTARGLTAKGRATRERILHNAMEMFAAQGYAAVSIRDVAERSGVSTGAIYATFRGKADLLAEAVSASLAADLELMEPGVQDRSLPETVGRQFDSGDMPGRRRLRLLLMNAATAARTDADVRRHLMPLLRARLANWTEAYRDWQAVDGVDPTLDMAALVAVLISIDLGLGVLDELGVDMPPPSTTSRLVKAMLLGLADASDALDQRSPTQ